jgi:hypothetical protein
VVEHKRRALEVSFRITLTLRWYWLTGATSGGRQWVLLGLLRAVSCNKMKIVNETREFRGYSSVIAVDHDTPSAGREVLQSWQRDSARSCQQMNIASKQRNLHVPSHLLLLISVSWGITIFVIPSHNWSVWLQGRVHMRLHVSPPHLLNGLWWKSVLRD